MRNCHQNTTMSLNIAAVKLPVDCLLKPALLHVMKILSALLLLPSEEGSYFISNKPLPRFTEPQLERVACFEKENEQNYCFLAFQHALEIDIKPALFGLQRVFRSDMFVQTLQWLAIRVRVIHTNSNAVRIELNDD